MYQNTVLDVDNSIDTIAIGIKLNKLRNEHNYSYDDIAEKLDVSSRAVYFWESGKRSLTIRHLVDLSVIYGVTTDDILCLNKAEDIVCLSSMIRLQ